MTQYLPPNLLALFAPRDPIPYLPPPDKLPYEKKTAGYTGVSAFLGNFEDPADTPPPTKIETREEKQEKKRRMKAEQVAYKLEQDIALWNPQKDGQSTTDPYKTLFVARVNYDSSESKLRREFEAYGAIKKIVLVHNVNNGKPRGYAFIEYEHERDMHSAYKHADGRKIDGRRVLVDVERGRTVKGWFPRRLGGGLGGTRRGSDAVNAKHSGREDARNVDDRWMGRDQRGDRPERRRSRSKSRERKRRSRSRSRDRHRHRRDRSRERPRNRGNDNPDAEKPIDGAAAEPGAEPRKERSRRSRSRDRERRRNRRSRSRDRRHRDRSDRDSRRDRGSRWEKSESSQQESEDKPNIKEEQPQSYDGYNNSNSGYEGDYGKYPNEESYQNNKDIPEDNKEEDAALGNLIPKVEREDYDGY